LQVFGDVHTEPHEPQLLLSDFRLVHVPLQSVYGDAQVHEPLMQVELPVQNTPHRPQLFLSFDRFAHEAPGPVPHWVSGVWHETTQLPDWHKGWLEVHAMPQPPQFVLLDWVSVQLPSPANGGKPPNESAHCVSPAGQLQVPFVHVPPKGQLVPHEPQLALSVDLSTHMDVRDPGRNPCEEHLVSPASPQPAAHLLLKHVVPPLQTLPHRPQLALFEVGSTHVAAHRMSEDEHWHIPFTQLAPPGHCWPQVPQWLGFAWRSTHALAQLVSVGPESVSQLTAHTPALQTGVPAGHAVPQPPQLLGSLRVCVQTLPGGQRMPL
jgi:hypothetical protein